MMTYKLYVKNLRQTALNSKLLSFEAVLHVKTLKCKGKGKRQGRQEGIKYKRVITKKIFSNFNNQMLKNNAQQI